MAYRAYHVVIIDARGHVAERVRVLPRGITDADERSLITLAARILSLALDALPRPAAAAAAAAAADRSNYLKLQQLLAEQ